MNCHCQFSVVLQCNDTCKFGHLRDVITCLESFCVKQRKVLQITVETVLNITHQAVIML